ncbi:MAG: 2-oxo acid dehydrogenase subunit E2 [Rhizobiaceae bacterium]
MARAKREIPHYYLSHDVDIQAAKDFVSRINEDRPPESRLLAGVLYVKAVATACRKYPEFNGHFENDRFTASEAVHAGMAVRVRAGGLIAPALHDVDSVDLDTLMVKMRDLVNRVRGGRFRASEFADATITITSLGDRGVDRLYGIINPPQVAIVGFGATREIATVVEAKIVARPTITLTLSADHRVSDGHRGALFLRMISERLQNPEAL